MVEQQLSEIFQALSDPTRRGMLLRLRERESTITELAAPYLMSFAAASKHVQVLERARLITRTIKGRTHICALNPQPLQDLNDWLLQYRN